MQNNDLKITQYRDNKGYAFISYSSSDRDKVFGEFVLPLQREHGLRVYYDAEFKNNATEGWTYQMIENLKRSEVCIVFISSAYASSYACMLEVLTAIDNNIPIIKVKLQTPEIAENEHTEVKMSEDTKAEFKELIDSLKETDIKSVKGCIRNISRYIKNGKISKFQVSESFCKYLVNISGTYIKETDGLEAIKNSIVDAQKRNAFEEIPVSPTTVNMKKERSNIEIKDRNTNTDISEDKQKEAKTTTQKRVASATGEIKYTVNGKVLVGNQTEMMYDVFEELTKLYPDKIAELPAKANCVSVAENVTKSNTKDAKPSYFRRCRSFVVNGTEYLVGTSYNIDMKMKLIATMISLCGAPEDFLTIVN